MKNKIVVRAASAVCLFFLVPHLVFALSYAEVYEYYQKQQLKAPQAKPIGKVLGATAPSLPRAYVDTSMPSGANTCTVNVASGGDLQAAIDSAKLGDTICVQAGVTYVGPFYLPKKTSGSGWLTIRTSNLDSNFVSPGTRVSPSNAGLMAKLVSPGSNAAVIQTKTAASNYRLIGLEITQQFPESFVSELVVLGDWWQSKLRNGVDALVEEQPTNIIFDRVYIHGDMTSETKRGIRMHCNNCAVVDSHISQIQSTWQDTQAIMGWNAAGPFKFVNNYLEASGENIMFGGADPSVHYEPTVMSGVTKSSATLSSVTGLAVGQGIMFTVGGKTGEANWTTVRSISGNNITFDALASTPDSNSKAYYGVVPSDFEIRKNYFIKPAYWNPKHPSFAGKTYAIKNLFETKSMQRVLLDSNIFENSWMSAQIGYGLLIKSSNQDGGCPYCFAQDITITNNLIKNVEVGIMFQGSESYNDWNKLTPVTKRVKIENNLFYNEPSWTNELSRGIQMYNGTSDVEFNHNTIFSTYNTFFTNYEDNVRNPNITLTNNIFERSAYGFGNVTEGKGYLDTYFPGYTYAKNLLVNTSARFSDADISNENLLNRYPSGTLVTNFSGVGFTDSSNGNFKLTGSSPYKNAGTDGKDIGVDTDALNAAIAGVKTSASQLPPPPPVSPIPVVPAPTPVTSDTIAPIISSLSAVNITNKTATINYATNENSTSVTYYQPLGGNTWFGSYANVLQTNFSIPIGIINSGTQYKYFVVVKDAAGNIATSTQQSFTTLGDQPVTSPVSCGSSVPNGEFLSCYYDNMDFTNLKVTRNESVINNEWGYGTPAPEIDPEQFSAVWQGNFGFEAGDWEFSMTTDDGMRLFVDGEALLDKMFDQSPTSYKAVKKLSAGMHKIRLDYYENAYNATAKLSWNKLGLNATADVSVSGLSALSQTTSSAEVSFNTNKAAVATLYYQANGASTWQSINNNTFSTNFHNTLSGLSPSTIYKYYAVVRDSSGFTATSSQQAFVTVAVGTNPTAPSTPSSPSVPATPSSPVVNTPSTPVVPVVASIVLPPNVKAGEIVKFGSSPTIYLVKDEGLYPFHSFESYKEYVNTQSNRTLKSFSQSESGFTLKGTIAAEVLNQKQNTSLVVTNSYNAALPYRTGTLVNDQGTIFLIIGKTKVAFTNLPAFRGFGYKLSEVVNGSVSAYESAKTYQISSSQGEHPWSSWLLNNKTVYYSHEQGMIPVPSWEIFLNNGGEANKILKMNDTDVQILNKSKLEPLRNNDPRIYK
ncbi:MAG: hypothetical protein JNN11_03410 [Candidatus Doudnabacteria bacterium]|nr:hypothetical protein [Candidatus Doudnabacteria bacterium]